MGAGKSFYVDVGLNLQYSLTQHFDIATGFSLTHFSNGAIKKPNYGLNTIAPKISLKYNFDENFFVGITLRDYAFHVSDFVEWNIGYRIKWN